MACSGDSLGRSLNNCCIDLDSGHFVDFARISTFLYQKLLFVMRQGQFISDSRRISLVLDALLLF